MQIRDFEPDADLPAVMALLAEIERDTSVPPLGESKFVDLTGPRHGFGLIGESDGLSMYAHVLHHSGSELDEMELAARSTVADVEVSSMVGEIAARTGGSLLWWTFGETRSAEFAGARLDLDRRLHKLAGPLPPAEAVPALESLRIAPFRPGVDDAAWLEVNNAAFHGHPENGQWAQEDLNDRLDREWFDADGFRLAWVGGRLAGFCWTKRHGESTGEIHIVAVHPEFQGGGIGRKIVVEALWYLDGVGCDSAMLYVDTVNESALALYQSLGFTLERVDRCFKVPKDWPHDPQ